MRHLVRPASFFYQDWRIGIRSRSRPREVSPPLFDGNPQFLSPAPLEDRSFQWYTLLHSSLLASLGRGSNELSFVPLFLLPDFSLFYPLPYSSASAKPPLQQERRQHVNRYSHRHQEPDLPSSPPPPHPQQPRLLPSLHRSPSLHPPPWPRRPSQSPPPTLPEQPPHQSLPLKHHQNAQMALRSRIGFPHQPIADHFHSQPWQVAPSR